ncbi:hypothetical protein B484DRAFT_101406 [Ochromonadaceae sp. CCMP2298]|nr:hypothetical protein B484DRAFT_101406 [Ochromonadaceae sp. CCMP2298]
MLGGDRDVFNSYTLYSLQVWERFFENAFNRTTVDMSDLDGELDRGGYGAPLPISTSASKSKSRSTALGYDSRGARSTLTDDEPARPGYGREQEVYPSNSSYSQAYAPPAPYERAKKGRGKKGQEDHESDYEAYRAGYAEGGQRKAAEGKQRQSGGRGDSASAQWLDWFAWIICFAPSEGEGGEGEGGEYFVLHRLTGERAWLTDHVARFLRDWGDFESHMAHALPTTLLEAASRGWATYYEPLSNACRWLSVPTKCLEDALPLGIGEQPEALRAQNMQAEYGMGGEGAWVSADQTCATAWVLVVGQPTSPLSPTYTRGREERGEEREQEEREGEEGPWMSSKLSESPLACVDDKDYWGEGGGDGDGDGVGSWDGAGAGAGAGAGVDETVYYYRNWVTGETRWVPPEGWEDLVEQWEGWSLCCSEESEAFFWHDFESGESSWMA